MYVSKISNDDVNVYRYESFCADFEYFQYQLHCGLCCSGYKVGNDIMYINDCGRDNTTPNCCFVEVVLYGKYPMIFCMTVRDLNAGDELLIEYGDQYWEHVDDLFARIQAVRKLL